MSYDMWSLGRPQAERYPCHNTIAITPSVGLGPSAVARAPSESLSVRATRNEIIRTGITRTLKLRGRAIRGASGAIDESNSMSNIARAIEVASMMRVASD